MTDKNERYEYFIYKIYRLDNDLIYVGSTRDMIDRKRRHLTDCYNINSSKYNTKIYKTIRENNGFENWNMDIMDVLENATKKEAEIQEEFYRNKLNASLNSRKASRGDITISEYHKQYQRDNKKHIVENKKQYYINNREKLRAKQDEKFDCNCGGKFTYTHKLRHLKTIKHKTYLELGNS